MAQTHKQAKDELISGGCHCGGIVFHFHKPVVQLLFCHCTACRKTIGSTVNDFIGVSLSNFVITKDSTLAEYRSSDMAIRLFCRNCGCSIGIQYDEEKHTFWLCRGLCNSDPGPAVLQQMHMWTEERSRAVWDHLTDDGIYRNLQFGIYQWDPAKNIANQ